MRKLFDTTLTTTLKIKTLFRQLLNKNWKKLISSKRSNRDRELILKLYPDEYHLLQTVSRKRLQNGTVY